MWVPGLVAIFIRRAQGVKVQPSLSLVWVSNRYVWIAAITPFALVTVISALNVVLTPATFELNEFYVNAFNEIGVAPEFHLLVLVGQTLVNGFLAGITINTFFALGEEIGWRGFLQKELGHLGLWKSGLLIGAIWGLWHAPLVIQGYNFEQHPLIGVVMMTVACAPLGLIMSYFVQRSGTIMSAGFFHGVFNAVAGLTLALVDDFVDYLHNPFGVTAILTYSALALLLYAIEKRRSHTIPL
jgi:membrane protease YdiL (CAAX protease family)